MGRRNDHSREQQRDMAIAAAELLIIGEGMVGFSMRKVATAMGYTVGQLYLLFRNQDALFVVLNERTADTIYAVLRDAMDGEPDSAQRVRLAARAYVSFAQHHPHRWQLMFEHRLPAGSPVPKANQLKVQQVFALIEERLQDLLPTADEQELHMQATALWSGVHGVAVLAQSNKLNWSGISDFGALTDRLVLGFI